MKTIEERAFDIAKEFGSTKSNKVRAIYRACVRMAIEQQKIDFEKAREWFTVYLMEIGYPDDWMRDSPNMLSGEERFRKAMEE